MKRPARLMQMQWLLYKNPDGLTSRELAELCQIHVRSIRRDLLDLQADLGVPITQDGDRYAILDGYALPPVSFSFYEAIAMFLACRLAMRQSGKSNPYMRQALEKIGVALPAPLAEYLNPVVESDGADETDSDFPRIFESVATAWMKHRQMKIRSVSVFDNQVREWLFEPYFMEMAGVGHSVYVIGRGRKEDGIDRILSFKLERIKSAEILETCFERPSRMEVEGLLSPTLDMMWEEETEVKLWFSRSVSDTEETVCRVVDPSNDGHTVILHVSGWLEAHPSATSLTGEIEVLSPASLKRYFSQYAQKLWQTFWRREKEKTKTTENADGKVCLIS